MLWLFICFPAAAGTIVTVTGTCTAEDGYTQSWTLNEAASHTCVDPDTPPSLGGPQSLTATFSILTLIASLDPSIGGEIVARVVGFHNSVVGDYWTNLTETVSVQDEETFVATGGTGQAYIEGTWAINFDDGFLGPVNTSFGSGTYEPQLPVPFAPIPFTFGQPFTLFMDALANYSGIGTAGNDAEAGMQANITGIVSANGTPLSGVQFTRCPNLPR
jgi:hypothetical protein